MKGIFYSILFVLNAIYALVIWAFCLGIIALIFFILYKLFTL